MDAAFCSYRQPELFVGDHDPEQEVDQYAWHPARDEGDEHRKPEPKGADPKEFTETAADTCQHPIPA